MRMRKRSRSERTWLRLCFCFFIPTATPGGPRRWCGNAAKSSPGTASGHRCVGTARAWERNPGRGRGRGRKGNFLFPASPGRSLLRVCILMSAPPEPAGGCPLTTGTVQQAPTVTDTGPRSAPLSASPTFHGAHKAAEKNLSNEFYGVRKAWTPFSLFRPLRRVEPTPSSVTCLGSPATVSLFTLSLPRRRAQRAAGQRRTRL